jgi:hypothetical protein
MDRFNTDDYNHSSYYFDQQDSQDYPWATDPTPTSDDSAAIYLNSNSDQDVISNVSNNPYHASFGVLTGQGSYSNGVIDSFDHSTGANQFLPLPTDLYPYLVVYTLYGSS